MKIERFEYIVAWQLAQEFTRTVNPAIDGITLKGEPLTIEPVDC